MNKNIVITNWTSEDFEHTWGGELIKIPANSSIEVEKGIGETLAYHLCVREMNKDNKDVGCFMNEYMAKATGGEVTPVEVESVPEGDISTPESTPELKGDIVNDDDFEGLDEIETPVTPSDGHETPGGETLEETPEEYDGPISDYRIVNPIEYTDEEGKSAGMLEVGSIQSVPDELGDKWVENGDAVKVVVENKED